MVLVASGCNGAAGTEDARAPDALSYCYGHSSDTRVCFSTPPDFEQALELRQGQPTGDECYNLICCAPNVIEPDVCVVTARTITVAERVPVFRPRPLVLLARDAITITATGALVSHGATPPDVSEDYIDCEKPPFEQWGGRTGAGGSFVGRGGAGTWPSQAVVSPTQLRGGCPGVTGVNASGPGGGGRAPGGGVALVSDYITIDGVINASGLGGGGCGPLATRGGCGGGGGGSGGMIVLEGNSITGTGILLANGGGGGGGETDLNGIRAPNGQDPSEASPTTPAAGGDVGADGLGAIGGAGAAGAMIDGQSGVEVTYSDTRLIGGGGGGAGLIRIHGPALTTATISPPPEP